MDDHPVVCHGLAAWVDRHEHDLAVIELSAASGEVFVEIDRARPRLVVMEISRPGSSAMDGLDLVRAIRARFPDLPVLVFSRCDELVFAERSLRAGANGFINKTAPLGQVAAAMRRVLGGQIYLSEQAATQLLHQYVAGESDGRPGLRALSDREVEVLHQIGQGRSTKAIASALSVSVKTIEAHRQHIKSKLKLKDGSELLQYAFRWGADRL